MNGQFGGGTGTQGDPMIVEDVSDFLAINQRDSVTTYYKLGADIDMNSHATYKYSIPASTIVNNYAVIDGDGHKIINAIFRDITGLYSISIYQMADVEFANVVMINCTVAPLVLSASAACDGCAFGVLLCNSGYDCLNFRGTSATGFTDCSFNLKGKISAAIRLHTNMTNCPIKVDLDLNGETLFVNTLSSNRTLSQCYIYGKIRGDFADDYAILGSRVLMSESYMEIDVEPDGTTAISVTPSSVTSGHSSSFIVNDISGNVTVDGVSGISSISTAQEHDVEYLQGLGFPVTQATS